MAQRLRTFIIHACKPMVKSPVVIARCGLAHSNLSTVDKVGSLRFTGCQPITDSVRNAVSSEQGKGRKTRPTKVLSGLHMYPCMYTYVIHVDTPHTHCTITKNDETDIFKMKDNSLLHK